MRLRPLWFLLFALTLALAPAGCRDEDANVPIALIVTPGTVGGRAVPIAFVLRNPDTMLVAIDALFSTNGGFTFQRATEVPGGEGTTNLSASPGGTTHVFVWNALADLGPGRHTNVVFSVAPTVFSNPGTLGLTFAFTVDNTDLFVRAPDLLLGRQRSTAAPTPEGGAIVAGGGGLSTLTEAFDPASEIVQIRGTLNTLREGAQATTILVADGAFLEPRPLVVAGSGVGVTLTSVEQYDSGADQWLLAAADVGPRVGHTVTRLLDGRALVAGGGPTTDALIADPGAAAATVAAGADRTGHSATSLPDGRVLVAGGVRAGAVLGDTLVFDPATDTYAPGPPLSGPRAFHAAALTSGGRVVVTGGLTALGAGAVPATPSAEIADAALAGFQLLPNLMVTARVAHTATALGDGTVVLIGGRNEKGLDLTTAERFLPASLSFAATRGSMEVARSAHDATAFGAGRIFVSGGATDADEVYLPQSAAGLQQFDAIAAPSAARVEHAVTALTDGRALITGGTNAIVDGGQPVALSSAELFDPLAAPNRLLGAVLTTLTAARRRHTATLLGDATVLIAGGLDAAGAPLASIEIASPSPIFSFAAAPETLTAGIAEHAAVRLNDGRVLIAGGRLADGSASAAAFLWNPTAAPGTRLEPIGPPLATARRRHTATLLPDGRVLLAGGITGAAPGTATASAEVFDPGGLTFTPTAGDLGIARFDHAAAQVAGGLVVVAGGRGGNNAASTTPTADVRRFEPTSLTFATLAPMLSPRADFAAVVGVGSANAIFAGGAIAAAPAGGPDESAPATASAESYNPAGAGATVPTLDPDLPVARRGLRGATTTVGPAILIGGRREAGAAVPGGERFSP